MPGVILSIADFNPGVCHYPGRGEWLDRPRRAARLRHRSCSVAVFGFWEVRIKNAMLPLAFFQEYVIHGSQYGTDLRGIRLNGMFFLPGPVFTVGGGLHAATSSRSAAVAYGGNVGVAAVLSG